MKTLAEVSEIDSFYYFLKQSIRQLQQLHEKGTAHGGIEPLTIDIENSTLLEGSLAAMYAAPEVALGLAVAEQYTPEEAVRVWKKNSTGLKLLERWLPGVAEGYSISVLQKLIGTPIPEQQSDIWSLGISYLSVYDSVSKEESFPEKELFFEALTSMVRVRSRSLPTFEASATVSATAVAGSSPPSGCLSSIPAEGGNQVVPPRSGRMTAGLVCDETRLDPPRSGRMTAGLVCDETRLDPPRSGRMKLSEPIRHGERNKTRRNLHN